MDIREAIGQYSFILAEAAVIESLRRAGKVGLDPLLMNAPLIYDDKGKKALSELYRSFISIAHAADIPITIGTPTWRANRERVELSGIEKDINGDAARFLKSLRNEWGSWGENVYIGGLVGCKNDCYKPEETLTREDAEDFHSWQIEKLAAAGVDYFLAVTLPAVPEAAGIARAMAETNVPYMISFVINRNGLILDGTSLEHALDEIEDAAVGRPPLGYMINCSYPSFLMAHEQPESVMSRVIGFQANASSLDQCELDGAEDLEVEDVSEWGEFMIELNKRFGVKILGGCCGTSTDHLEYIVRNI
jgi:homocysteine S-methyltransferase